MSLTLETMKFVPELMHLTGELVPLLSLIPTAVILNTRRNQVVGCDEMINFNTERLKVMVVGNKVVVPLGVSYEIFVENEINKSRKISVSDWRPRKGNEFLPGNGTIKIGVGGYWRELLKHGEIVRLDGGIEGIYLHPDKPVPAEIYNEYKEVIDEMVKLGGMGGKFRVEGEKRI